MTVLFIILRKFCNWGVKSCLLTNLGGKPLDFKCEGQSGRYAKGLVGEMY